MTDGQEAKEQMTFMALRAALKDPLTPMEAWLTRAELAHTETEQLNNTLLQVSAFLRNWMPSEKGPMMAQFNKMLDEVDTALLPVRETALASKKVT